MLSFPFGKNPPEDLRIPTSTCESQAGSFEMHDFFSRASNPLSILSDLGILSNSGNAPNTQLAFPLQGLTNRPHGSSGCNRGTSRNSVAAPSASGAHRGWTAGWKQKTFPNYRQMLNLFTATMHPQAQCPPEVLEVHRRTGGTLVEAPCVTELFVGFSTNIHLPS
jgi:hypothetical protein